MQRPGLPEILPQILPYPVPVAEKHRGDQPSRLGIFFQSSGGGPDHMGPQGSRHPCQARSGLGSEVFHFVRLNAELEIDAPGSEISPAIELAGIFRLLGQAEISGRLDPIAHFGPMFRGGVDSHQNPSRTSLPILVALNGIHHHLGFEDLFAPFPNSLRRQLRHPPL